VLNNNFLMCAATPQAKQLEQCYPLEGSQLETKNEAKGLYFELFSRKKTMYFRAPNSKECAKWKNHIADAAKLKIKDIYRFMYTLGTSESQTNKVVAAKHKRTGESSAIKIVDKRGCDAKMLKTEIRILKKLDSKHIVQLYDIFETRKFLYIVMEMCIGGELFDQIAELDGENYSVKDCCLILHQIASGVKYMHKMGIVHRDLKPENILCVERNSIKKVKIADFGVSKVVSKKQKAADKKMMKTVVGTLSYTAPEILRGKGYDHTVDYWSIGVIMFILLCGYPPFYGDDNAEISNAILKDELEFEEEDWEHVPQETRAVCAGLLQKDPAKRLGTDALLRLVFKTTSKNDAWKLSRKKFKSHVIERKMHTHSLFASRSSTKQKHRLGHSHDDNHHYHSDKRMTAFSKQHTASKGRRGSHTTDQMELNLPNSMRDSFVADFETDDDRRKREQRQKEERQHKRYEEQQMMGIPEHDGDDSKEDE